MLLVTALVSFVVLATRVAASRSKHSKHHPHSHSLSITKHINPQANYSPVLSDRRRLTSLMTKANPDNSSNPVVDSETADLGLALNDAGPCYVASIGFGEPPTYYNLIVDTGSSVTWVGANASYVKTNTSEKTLESVGVIYGSGFFIGNLYNDTVTIAPGLTASNQSIGVATNSTNISPLDGILGIGPASLTNGSLFPDSGKIVPTVTDNLFSQGAIKQNLLAVSFEPAVSKSTVNGELTFGATDPNKYIGKISYFPVTESANASRYWGIDAAIQYGGGRGNASVSLSGTTAGFVDTGTTLLHLSTSAYKRYAQATGGKLDKQSGLLRITQAQYKSLQPINFVIGGETFGLTPDAQVWARARETTTKGDVEYIYLAVQDIGPLFPGVDFICGMVFLERFYSVFDTGNHRIGLARTAFTNATVNS